MTPYCRAFASFAQTPLRAVKGESSIKDEKLLDTDHEKKRQWAAPKARGGGYSSSIENKKLPAPGSFLFIQSAAIII